MHDSIDDFVISWLRKKKMGWNETSLPAGTEISTEGKPKVETANCKDCGRFIWRSQLLCTECLRMKGVQQALSAAGDDRVHDSTNYPTQDACEVQIEAFIRAMHKIKWSQCDEELEKQLEKHQRALDLIRRANVDKFSAGGEELERLHEETHHSACVELLELARREVTYFEVKNQKKHLGFFKGSLEKLEDLIYENEKAVRKLSPARDTGKEMLSLSNFSKQKQGVHEEVPLLCVVVQGGPNSIDSIMDSVENGSPVLLVKGSGMAACLMSDAVILMKPDEDASYDRRLQRLCDFILKLQDDYNLKLQDEEQRGTKGSFKYTELIACFSRNHGLLVDDMKRKELDDNWPLYRQHHCADWAGEKDLRLKEAFEIETRVARIAAQYMTGSFRNGEDTFPRCITGIFAKVFAIADAELCQVYLLHDTDPDAPEFKDALLGALLHGMCQPVKDTVDTLQKKVPFPAHFFLMSCQNLDCLTEQRYQGGIRTTMANNVADHVKCTGAACDPVGVQRYLERCTHENCSAPRGKTECAQNIAGRGNCSR